MDKSTFIYVTYIRTTPEKLWQALTQPEFQRQFFYGTHQECGWQPGDSWKLMIPGGRVGDSGEVLEADPPFRLVLKWRCHMTPEHFAEGFTRMTYLIGQSGGSVKLTVTHEIDKPGSKLIADLGSGWPPILASLKSLLETGESLKETRQWPEGM